MNPKFNFFQQPISFYFFVYTSLNIINALLNYYIDLYRNNRMQFICCKYFNEIN